MNKIFNMKSHSELVSESKQKDMVKYGFRNKLFATLIPCGTASRHRLRLGMTQCCNESGRTMLEMLGVLAIMGIITYGAISGINYGMGSYKINQTYNEVQDIIRGVEDLYSWSKGYPEASEIMEAACKNDIFAQTCTGDVGHKVGHGAFGDITIDTDATRDLIDGSDPLRYNNFYVKITLDDDGECARLTSMEWDAINIKCTDSENRERTCSHTDAGYVLNFSPK